MLIVLTRVMKSQIVAYFYVLCLEVFWMHVRVSATALQNLRRTLRSPRNVGQGNVCLGSKSPTSSDRPARQSRTRRNRNLAVHGRRRPRVSSCAASTNGPRRLRAGPTGVARARRPGPSACAAASTRLLPRPAAARYSCRCTEFLNREATRSN